MSGNWNRMSPTVVIFILATVLSVTLITLLMVWLGRRRLRKRLEESRP